MAYFSILPEWFYRDVLMFDLALKRVDHWIGMLALIVAVAGLAAL